MTDSYSDYVRRRTPWRRAFDHARDPMTARNVLGIADGGGAPTTAEYLTKSADATLSAERVVTDAVAITWNWATAGQVKAIRAALTGDVTAAVDSNATTLATVNANVGTFQGITVNAKGLVTAAVAQGYLTANQTITLSGDVTGSGATAIAATIANDAVTYAKMQNVSATSRFVGRITAGAGDPEELTGTQATTLIDVFTSTLKGLAPSSGGGTTNFLRADGAWTAPAATGGVTSIAGNTGAFTLGQGLTNVTNDLQVASTNVVQTAYAEVTAYNGYSPGALSGGVDGVPQNTDGVQILSVTITPKATTNKLLVHATVYAAVSAATSLYSALFQDATAGALASAIISPPGVDYVVPVTGQWQITAGTTSATTLKVRVGPIGAASLYINGVSGGRRLGGSLKSTITVMEIKA